MSARKTDFARRQQILSAAERLLRHYGPTKTTVSDIAKEAAVAVGSVYLEFAGKDAILEELSSRRYASVLAPMREAAKDATRPYAARVRVVFERRTRAFQALSSDGVHGSDLLHCVSSGVQGAHARFLGEQSALVEQLILDGIAAGELAAEDPALAAEALLAAWAPLSPPWLFRLGGDKVDRLVISLGALVCDGLRAR
jgi:AcrR family transcriptional regulator